MTRLPVALAALLLLGSAAFAQNAPDPSLDPIPLIRGDTLDGWQVFVEDKSLDPAAAWRVQDGVLSNVGPGTGYIRTTHAYADYTLSLEWRWPERYGNSGVIVNIVNWDRIWPKGFQAELLNDHTGDMVSYADARNKEELVSRNPRGQSTGRLRRNPADAPEKPIGEWNTLEMKVQGDTITVTSNGIQVNKVTGCTPTGGMIGFQAEGSVVELRNIIVTPLPWAKDLHAPMPAGG